MIWIILFFLGCSPEPVGIYCQEPVSCQEAFDLFPGCVKFEPDLDEADIIIGPDRAWVDELEEVCR